MDSNYVKFGITDTLRQLTELGNMYGMYLIININRRNRNENVSVDCWSYVSPCHIPKNVFNMKFGIDDDNPLTPFGVKWVQGYIENNEFNPYIYSRVKNIDLRGCLKIHISHLLKDLIRPSRLIIICIIAAYTNA
jgi:hypothetical protein